MMDKLELYLNYKIKLLLILVVTIIFFTSCSDKENKKINKPVKEMVNIVKKTIDENTTLSQTVQKDGIVIHGARDEELLDAFGLAVSQVIVEDGVSVPDCIALEKTGYLTKDECEEVSTKYFGFYELGDDGEGKKVGDVFKSGIAGSEIKIQNSNISYFDSSGNPLLENQIEFDEVVASSNDLDFLKGLKSEIPANKKEMIDNVRKKIDFLESVEEQEIANVVENVQSAQTNTNNISNTKDNIVENNNIINIETDNVENDKLKEEVQSKYNSVKYNLNLLKVTNRNTEEKLNENPNDTYLIDKYNKERESIAILEQELEIYLSQLEGL